ncbi:MAG: hypothetical protein IPL03_04820 [Sterolibacteriaceae bacterium]|nr:hypothetical protein [Candidatus Methylophosphatis haderslevensis]
MKLADDADARARLRMLRVWLTPEQYRDVREGLAEVEAPPRGFVRRCIADGVADARNRLAAGLRRLADAVGGARSLVETHPLRR